MNENDPQLSGQQPAQPEPDQPVQPQPEQPQPVSGQPEQTQPAQPEPDQPVQPQPASVQPPQPQPAQPQPVQPQLVHPQTVQQPYQPQPTQQYYQQQAQPQYQQQPPVKGKRGSGPGIAALVLGIIGAVLSFIPVVNIFSFPLVITGLILGIVSLVMARGGQGPKGFGIAGIACSAVALIITVVVYVALAVLAATAADTTVYDYIEDNAPTSSILSTSATEDIVMLDAEWNEVDSTSYLEYITVTLENTSSEDVEYVYVEIPLYNSAGVSVVSAYGYAIDAAPGVFTIEAVTFAEEGEIYTFYLDEIVITTF